MDLPKFDLPHLSFEEFEAVEKSAESRTNLKPGHYEGVIAGVAIAEDRPQSDPTWLKAKLTIKVGTETINETVMLPTSSYTYGDKKSGLPFKRLKTLLTSVGALSADNKIAADEFPRVMEACFSNNGRALVDKNVAVKLDYLDHRIASEEINGAKRYFILLKSGLKYTDKTGAVVYLPDMEAARAYSDTHNIRTFNKVKVAEFMPPARNNKFSWKKSNADF